ncbi:hypothetical protein ACI77O_12330 [Pseudomonas tritici]|uniref:hypothetical protein n=1 Tax=Pseudomonas tritici TaxID=2745518 RepID=UPI00387AC1C2
MSYDTKSAALALSGGCGKLIEIPVNPSGRPQAPAQRRLIRANLVIDVYDNERGTSLRMATSEIIETNLSFDEVKELLS